MSGEIYPSQETDIFCYNKVTTETAQAFELKVSKVYQKRETWAQMGWATVTHK
jgi:hypothetical protein